MSDRSRWTDAAGIAAVVRRAWSDGTLLRGYVRGEEFPRIEVPLRGPTAATLGEQYEQARAWADAVYRGSRDGRSYELMLGSIGGRVAGRTELPTRAVIAEYAQAWALLKVEADAKTFLSLAAQAQQHPLAEAWALAHPVQAIGLIGEWTRILTAVAWLDENRDSGLHLRQVTAPGVDTKFIERHRTVLAQMLGVPPRDFARALGFAQKPSTVRLRFDPALFAFPAALTEGVFRAEELRSVHVRPQTALIVENEITYLSVPVPVGGVVLWGKGYSANEPASLDWLVDVDVRYWGDIDTHGFAILDRVRAHLPQTRSVLMDRETLLAHESRWGAEPTPTSAALSRLDAQERGLYQDLVSDQYAARLRLEQERIDWGWASQHLDEGTS